MNCEQVDVRQVTSNAPSWPLSSYRHHFNYLTVITKDEWNNFHFLPTPALCHRGLMFLRADTIGWLSRSQCILCLRSVIVPIDWQQIRKDNNRPTCCPLNESGHCERRQSQCFIQGHWSGGFSAVVWVCVCVSVCEGLHLCLARLGGQMWRQWSPPVVLQCQTSQSLTQSLWRSSTTLMELGSDKSTTSEWMIYCDKA